MQTRLILKPGEKGTKKLAAEYGERLVCVRYRYDPAAGKRFKTVELVVEEKEWKPEKSILSLLEAQGAGEMVAADTAPAGGPPPCRAEALVSVRIGWGEAEFREAAKRAGGRWNPERKTWEMRYDRAVAAGLRERVIAMGGSQGAAESI